MGSSTTSPCLYGLTRIAMRRAGAIHTPQVRVFAFTQALPSVVLTGCG